MTYKETLFFIGKCLTITHEEHNCLEVEKALKKQQINWDAVVKVSTEHYVFSALYGNLKRANFLSYLPEELVNYMIHITELNRERNQQIIEQAKKINKLLLANNIKPIFLKGTGFLLQDFYEDIAERMVGDIDFLVSDKEFEKTIKILKEDGYNKLKNEIDTTFVNRHFPTMVKKNKIGGVEIHNKMLLKPFDKFFNYNYIKDSLKIIKHQIHVLSNENQLLMTCFNKQINDKGNWFKTVSLRSSYDLFLLSKKVSTLNVLKDFSYYFIPLNNFLASTFLLFNKTSSISFENNIKSQNFVKTQLNYINFPKKEVRNRNRWNLYFLYKSRFLIVIKSLYNKDNRTYMIQKTKNLFKPNS